MEKINIIGDNPHERLMLNAFAQIMETDPKGHQEIVDRVERCDPAVRATYVNVECRMNGVEVPLIAALEEMLKRASKQWEEEATRKAVDIIKTSGLGPLYDTLFNLRYEVARKIEEAGFTVPEDSF